MQIRSLSSLKNSLHHPQQQQQQPTTTTTHLTFAVMASPEVLKKAGRNCPETPEQMNLVELMCEFVEAMNPGLTLSKKPQILKDRDLTGELKDIWSAVQNFRDKEKAGVSDIVVYTEFGPESSRAFTEQTYADSHHHPLPCDSNGHEIEDELDSPDKSIDNDNKEEEIHNILQSEHVETTATNGTKNKSSQESEEQSGAVVVIEKLSLDDNAGSKKSKNSNNINENESSEKLVKVQNQKNQSHQHHFFPKFLTSSKDKDTKEREKEKEKDESSSEAKVKTKKSLNFFRRNKTTSTTGSPTHATATTTTTTSVSPQKNDAD
jgi:hypothetical protein